MVYMTPQQAACHRQHAKYCNPIIAVNGRPASSLTPISHALLSNAASFIEAACLPQILYAEREFMAAQMKNANANNASLSKEVALLKRQLAEAQEGTHAGPAQDALLSGSSSGSISNDIFADANR